MSFNLDQLAAVIESRKPEHGGDPASVRFFHDTGLDYVSCSPFRVPIARLEAGRAASAAAGSDSR